MDFNGIKKMLLACFVCFNVYLLSMWFEGRSVVTSSNGSAITIQQQLEERGIRLLPQALATSEGQLPLVKSKKSTVLRQLQYATFGDSVNIQGEQAKHVLERPLSIGIELPKDNAPLSDEILQIIRDKFIEQETYVLQGQSYTHVRYSPLDKMMTFYKVAMNGKPIVDGTAEIRVFFNEQSQIVEYTQTYKENFTEVSAFTPMISAERALQHHRVYQFPLIFA